MTTRITSLVATRAGVFTLNTLYVPDESAPYAWWLAVEMTKLAFNKSVMSNWTVEQDVWDPIRGVWSYVSRDADHWPFP